MEPDTGAEPSLGTAQQVRTDLDVCRTVQNVLWWTGLWRGNDIDVSVERGCVTLRGEIAWDYQRRTALHAVRGVPGVVKINDELAIKFDQGAVEQRTVEQRAVAQSTADGEAKPDAVSYSRWS